MSTNKGKDIGVDPKCMKDYGTAEFLTPHGKIYPCCFVYTAGKQLDEWASENGVSMDDIDVGKHGYVKVRDSEFLKKFYDSFNLDVCKEKCGGNGFTTDIGVGFPQWVTYKDG